MAIRRDLFFKIVLWSFYFQGEILLLEFFIKDISTHPFPLTTDSGKSMVSIFIKFHRELGNMVNTYFQTFLLCLMAYLTLYINLADFGNRWAQFNFGRHVHFLTKREQYLWMLWRFRSLSPFSYRFMGALTSLLVLASLLASIEENLPKTSYFKKIDVWFMSYIIFIFVIIVFHICVDYWAGCRDEIARTITPHAAMMQFRERDQLDGGEAVFNPALNSSTGASMPASAATGAIKRAKNARAAAAYLNNWGKVVFPILLTVFTTLYFVLSMMWFPFEFFEFPIKKWNF